MYQSIVVSNRAAKRIGEGLLWLREDDVVGRKAKIAQIVKIIGRKNEVLGMAFLSPSSRYYLRIFSGSEEKVDADFWQGRIARAYDRRKKMLATTDAVRVVHAEADGIPAVVIDKYNDVWSFQVTSACAEALKGIIIDIIKKLFDPKAIVEKDDISARRLEDLPLVEGVVFGSEARTIIKERDQKFSVDVLRGQKTGAYLDYRSIRRKARELARGDCLDAFCYEGWLACRIASNADRVVAIDSSSKAIDAARENVRLNNHGNVECLKADVFEYLKGCDDAFDFIHLDPPSFSKGGGSRAMAIKGYEKLLTLAFQRLKKGGALMVSSCSHAITERILEQTTLKIAEASGFKAEAIWRGIQDSDHPVIAGHPESLYLKALAVGTSPL